jgi:hypothetical protein
MLIAFFVLPAWFCFRRLIRTLHFRTLAASWRWSRPRLARGTSRGARRRLRQWIVRPASYLAAAAVVLVSLLAGCLLTVELASVFDPSRNLTIEGLNVFPDPQGGQNAQLLSFVLHNGTDHPVVLGVRGPRVTVRVPAREPCREAPAFAEHLELQSAPISGSPLDGLARLTAQQAMQLAGRVRDLAQDLAYRQWLRSCAELRGPGVEIPFTLVTVAPVAAGGSVAPGSEQPPHSATMVEPGASVAVVARELTSDVSNIVMRCLFMRLVPNERFGEGLLSELQLRVVVVGGSQIISSDFRRYPALLLQPTDVMGTSPKRPCNMPATVPSTRSEVAGTPSVDAPSASSPR